MGFQSKRLHFRILRASAFLTGGVLVLLSIPEARGACNSFPSADEAGAIFKGTDGAVDAPFASPGDRVRIENAALTAAAPVTAFVLSRKKPGAPTVIAIEKAAADCPGVIANIDACAIPGVERECVEQSDLDPQAGAVELVFPDTSHGSIGFSIAGTVSLTVTTNDFAPCDLINGTKTCRTIGGTAEIVACVDELLRTTPAGVEISDPVFPHFAALPQPNNFVDLCDNATAGPMAICNGPASDIEFALDADGNMLIPMSWAGIWPSYSAPPYPPRNVRGSTSIKATPSAFAPISLPSDDYLASLNSRGRTHSPPPTFRSQKLRTHGNELVLVGTADEERSVLHVARRIRVTHACVRGTSAGQACTASDESTDCPDNGRCAELGTGFCTADGTACTIGSNCPDGSTCSDCVGGFLCKSGALIGTICDPGAASPCAGEPCVCEPAEAVGFFQCFDAGPATGQTCARRAHCPTGGGTFSPRCSRARCNGNSGRSCRLDSDCPGSSGPCGLPLYDLSQEHQAGDKRRPVDIPRAPGATRSGVCNAPRSQSNGASCDALTPCGGGAPCVMFRAELGLIAE